MDTAPACQGERSLSPNTQKIQNEIVETPDCPYLGAAVELTDEREAHIRRKHPDVFAMAGEYLRGALENPDVIQVDTQHGATRLLARWYDDLKGGKYLIAVVVSGPAPARHWIVTAFVARRLGAGAIEWQR